MGHWRFGEWLEVTNGGFLMIEEDWTGGDEPERRVGGSHSRVQEVLARL